MKIPPTWLQYFEMAVTEIAEEYQCSRLDAHPGASCRLDDWRRDVLSALLAGATPSQSWVNSVNADEASAYWWKMRVLHDHPDLFDRLSHAGLSLLRTKQALERGVG